MLTPQRAAELLAEISRHFDDPVQVYWCRVDSDSRDRFGSEILASAGSPCIVPIKVGPHAFVDPNAILADLNRLFGENEAAFRALECAHGSPVIVALLARNDLRLAVTGSLIQLPAWFPKLGGQEVLLRLRDLHVDVEVVPFNAPEARADDIAAHLYELERALVGRITRTQSASPNSAKAFWSVIASVTRGGVGREDIERLLDGYASHLASVPIPRAYRPAAKSQVSLLSHLVALGQRTSPNEMLSLAGTIAKALGVPADASVRLPFIAVALRPTQPMAPDGRFCHALLATIYGSYQFLNAAAHASDYPGVSVAFLSLNSRDLRVSLRDLARALDEFPTPT